MKDSNLTVNYAYAWRNGWRWALCYLQRGLITASVRTIWFSLVRGHMGEACQECGRPYLFWRSPDDVYESVTGTGRSLDGQSAPGLYCPDCFDKKARRKGIVLQWKPEVFT